LALTPFRTCLGDVRPILLGRPQRFFLNVKPSSLNVCQINPTLADTRCVDNSQARNSSSLVSPCSATRSRIAG
jgi:hypothetical protein